MFRHVFPVERATIGAGGYYATGKRLATAGFRCRQQIRVRSTTVSRGFHAPLGLFGRASEAPAESGIQITKLWMHFHADVPGSKRTHYKVAFLKKKKYMLYNSHYKSSL